MKRTSTLLSPPPAVPVLRVACGQGSDFGATEGYQPDVPVARGELTRAGQ